MGLCEPCQRRWLPQQLVGGPTLLTFGEGWHNKHHAYPSSARMGFRWWELDLTWQHIRLLHRLGLARRIRLAPLLVSKATTSSSTS